MSLSLRGRSAQGKYFYAGHWRDIRLDGTLQDDGSLLLDEIDATGKVVARFDVNLPEIDPRHRLGNETEPCGTIVGTWGRLADEKRVPVYLAMSGVYEGELSNRYRAAGAQDDSVVDRAAEKFWLAVKDNQREAVASCIRYPIGVTLDGKSRKIKDRADLLANYGLIFSPGYREAILQGMPHGMFARDTGVMLGDGEVWFDGTGKVIALNNSLAWTPARADQRCKQFGIACPAPN